MTPRLRATGGRDALPDAAPDAPPSALPCGCEPLLSARPDAAARLGMRHLITAIVIRAA